ncbi:hypothetical protein BDK51DRAFT_34178 [Blyttiomyces helicus]|uniref:Uncharacterized protein n=1 Tax=Blyttiomyces helicus TaxID=388810 RepID=A0A4V1IRJ1_9FUNG|nr:hypothetical protein BDK51DRAFT_34178 [Blyttiomyces helicus]|eukprot:RKO90237.1 hypothetical protein BDK51DRAFT_34178 [Blyttiomyces helicus]
MYLRNIANQMLAREFPSIHSDSVINKSVYATGLRMLWWPKGMMGSKTSKQTKSIHDDHERIFPGDNYNETYALVVPESFQPLVPMLEHLQWTPLATDEEENVSFVDHATKIAVTKIANCLKMRKKSIQDNFEDKEQTDFKKAEYSIIKKIIEAEYSRDRII